MGCSVVAVGSLLSHIVKPCFVTDATNESYHPYFPGGKVSAHLANPRPASRDNPCGEGHPRAGGVAVGSRRPAHPRDQ